MILIQIKKIKYYKLITKIYLESFRVQVLHSKCID